MDTKDKIEEHFKLKQTQKKALENLSIITIRDLLYHFPTRFLEPAKNISSIEQFKEGEKISIEGTITSASMSRTFKKLQGRRRAMAKNTLRTVFGNIYITWFSQPYMAKKFPKGSNVKVEGVVKKHDGKFSMTNPEMKPIAQGEILFEKANVNSFQPTYKESKGISSLWMREKIEKALSEIKDIEDPIPENIRKKFKLPPIKDSLIYMHKPIKKTDSEIAKKRFAFEEIFLFQIRNAINRTQRKANKTESVIVDKGETNKFIKEKFPYTLTNAQKKSVEDILKDLSKDIPMSRLLEGDVGSGKTAVAACAMYSVVTSKPEKQDFGTLQVAYMAPTEILAKQQFATLCDLFKDLPISIGLITSKECKKFPSKVNKEEVTKISKTQLKKWVENGETAVVVGTHSLVQKDIKFKHLSFAIVDEQHRFGVMQRKKLLEKGNKGIHLLSMTATPIPRTLALSIYGDLDISVIDELPPERKEVETKLLKQTNKKTAYKKIEEEVKKGRQAYIICPKIEQIGTLDIRSVEEEHEYISKDIFPNYKIEMLHGRMKKEQKEKTMQDFYDGKTQILVSTTVIEVGINVENATTILIENAERFGLAELHQLRGRVLRSNHKPYCFVITNSTTDLAIKRLKLFEKYSDGFLLAEKDLELRGTGELIGTQQSGVSDIAMEGLKNVKLVEAARETACELIERDPKLKEHKTIQKIIKTKLTHME